MARVYRKRPLPDRFEETMAAALGHGHRAPRTLARMGPILDVSESAEPHRPPRLPAPDPRLSEAIYVDASHRDGVTGLAVVGVIGTHSRRLTLRGSTKAELLALRLGDAARAGRRPVRPASCLPI